MDLLNPEPGLIIWSGLTFLIVLYLLTKLAWKPMLAAIKEREDSIQNAVEEAKKVAEDRRQMNVARQEMEAEMRKQRDAILKEARELKDKIVDEAKQSAMGEAEKIMRQTRDQIAKEKKDAVAQMKAQVADLAVQIASQILTEELRSSNKHDELINKYLEQANFN